MALDHHKYIQFVNLLNRQNFFSNANNSVISPLFNCLCVITKQKDGLLYLLPNHDVNIAPFWQCPSKVHRCIFSEDGKYILMVLNVNSIQIYCVRDQHLAMLVQLKASVLTDIMKPCNVDYSSASNVEPLRLENQELVICVDKKYILNVVWSKNNEPSIKYSVCLNFHRDVSISGRFIFVLFNSGLLNSYSLLSGDKCSGEVNTSALGVGTISKFSIHPSSNIAAVVNESEETVLVDINSRFNCSDKAKHSSGDVTVAKEKWTWPYKSRKPNTEPSMNLYKIFGKISPLPGLVVCRLQFSLKGLFVFYGVLGESKCSSLKVVDEYSGETLFAFDGFVESTLVGGGPLPVLMTDSILSICLGVLCNDYFIIKLCETVPGFSFSKELEKKFLSQSDSGSFSFHFAFLKIILNMHLNTFKAALKTLHTNKNGADPNGALQINFSEKRLMENMSDLFKAVLEYKESASQVDFNVKQEMVVQCFLHAVHLVDIVQETKKETTQLHTELFPALLKQILNLFESLQPMDPLQSEWTTWLEMTDAQVVQEAITVDAIGLAHVFLVTKKKWSVDDVVEKFKTEAQAKVVDLIMMNDLKQAKIVLANMGCHPTRHLKLLCLNTSDYLLRNILANDLVEMNALTPDEVAAWNFNKLVESAIDSNIKRHRAFEMKFLVSASQQVPNTMCKLSPYTGSIELTKLLKCSKEWRDGVLTEAYFSTGDVTLEKALNKESCWQYLVETNQVVLLANWIRISCDPSAVNPLDKSCDFLTRNFYNLFSEWPITDDMIDQVFNLKCMALTKNYVLDTFATYGLFSTLEKISLEKIIKRVENNCMLSKIRLILSERTSNVTLSDFDNMVANKCLTHSLNPVILACLVDSKLLKNSPAFTDHSLWIETWNLFSSWLNNKFNNNILKDVIKSSINLYKCNAQQLPILHAAVALVEEREISDVIESEGKECSLLRLPLIDINWEATQSAQDRTPDVSLYDLLSRSNVPVEKIWLWQSQNRQATASSYHDIFPEFPHFNHQILGTRYGSKQSLDYTYYLKQGRPSFACNLFVVDSLRTQRRLTTKMIKRVCGMAHGLAIRFWRDGTIGSACVAFIMMLGDISSANILRIHLGTIECICNRLSKSDQSYVDCLVRGIVAKELLHVQDTASILESSITTNSVDQNKPVGTFKKWYLAVSFCNIHSLPLPTSYLKCLARSRRWFPFVICLDIFKYPYEQAMELIEEFDSKILKSHLIRALTRTTLKLSTTSPSKSPPKILLEPENIGKDDFELPSAKDKDKDIFQSFVANVYTEVLNTIQTFTDKNIVLPWSCEQDPDSDVLLTLLKCESEPDTSKSLLISAIELQSPVLALLATFFQSDNIFPNLTAWLVSSIPTSMTRIKRREEGQQLVDRIYVSKEVETLFINFFSTGYFQTFFRGMNIFMQENPITIFLNAVYNGIVLLDFETSLDLLKEFTVEITHFRAKEASSIFSKSWILNVVEQCIGNVLTRPDVESFTKRRFLRILAESDFSALDASFPNYLLWSQVCDILESSDTGLDFIQLYDITIVSEELLNCLENLVLNHQYIQVLEICSLLSINKDKFVIAQWRHQLQGCLNAMNGDVQRLWRECSLAFKDENVNPTLAASFYQEMASYFGTSSSERLHNKYLALDYCLHWRKLMRDTLSMSFREENDSIELEKWKCCLDWNFDINFVKNAYPVEESDFLLINIWAATKVLVRFHIADELKRKRVDDLVNILLERGDLFSALRLGTYFKSENQDLLLISSSLRVIQNEVTVAELSNLSATFSAASGKHYNQWQSSIGLNLPESEIVPTKEQSQMLAILDKLCQIVRHGKLIANKILVCYRLSANLDSTFKDIASERDYLAILPRFASLDGVNKFSAASDLITLASLSQLDLAKFLKDRIVSAIVESHSTDLLMPVTLWDVPLDSNFQLIVNLMNNPSLLGFELLQTSISLPCSSAVEVLIMAHDCFSASCHVEGIGRVLRRARILASLALQEEQWQHLVRLLTGIKRYTDMSYIFQMLKDNGQFEHLLRKGMHKVPGLHVSISEFLQRHSTNDKELSKMVCAHFGLHSKLANLWQEEAEDLISKLSTVDNLVKDTRKTRNLLNMAMDNYSHAVHWYLQAGKLNRALKVAHKAQLVALQISLLGGPLVLRLNSQTELQTLVNENLSVTQALLISRACDLEPDWTAALHERWVLKGDKTFYAELRTFSVLSPHFIENYSSRYDLEQLTNYKAKERMKQLLVGFGKMQSPLFSDMQRNQL